MRVFTQCENETCIQIGRPKIDFPKSEQKGIKFSNENHIFVAELVGYLYSNNLHQ